MNLPLVLAYLFFFVLTSVSSLVINFFLLRFLKNLGVQQSISTSQNNNIGLIRWAKQQKPAVGGISFFLLFLIALGTYFIWPFEHSILINSAELIALIGATSIGFFLGLIDDIQPISPRLKLIGQLVCGGIILAMGIFIPISNYLIINSLFTLFWVVGIMNSINMLDNMDGITASVASFIVISLLLIINSTTVGHAFYNLMLLSTLAALLGFLYFNWQPAKMYMGDAGSQFLGAFLAVLSIIFLWQHKSTEFISIQQFLLPGVVFMLPIFDTTTVFIRRIARGQSPFQGGRDHTTHHLAYCGLTDKQVAIVFVLTSFLLSLLAFWINNKIITGFWTYQYSLFIILFLMLAFIILQFFYEVGKKKQNNKN